MPSCCSITPSPRAAFCSVSRACRPRHLLDAQSRMLLLIAAGECILQLPVSSTALCCFAAPEHSEALQPVVLTLLLCALPQAGAAQCFTTSVLLHSSRSHGIWATSSQDTQSPSACEHESRCCCPLHPKHLSQTSRLHGLQGSSVRSGSWLQIKALRRRRRSVKFMLRPR